MITIKDVKTLDGETATINLLSRKEHVLDANGLLLIPGVIDPHISCGSPRHDNWLFTVESAVRGGVTTILDIPCQDFHCETKGDLELKMKLVEQRFAELGIPLRYLLYGKGNSERADEIGLEKSLIIGSIILLTPESSELDERTWNRIFQLAAWEDFPVVINSRNENAWRDERFKSPDDTLLGKALYYAEKQNTRLYVLNVSKQQEIDLIEDARRRSLLVYAETTPQHLFPRDDSNPDFLWEALNKGVIETIGSGYRSQAESDDRVRFQGAEFDFLNPRFLLPLLLTAHLEGKITMENIVRATRINLYDVFKIERKDQDVVLVDMEKEKTVQRMDKGKFSERILKGWPVYTIIKGEIFSCEDGQPHLVQVE